VARPKLEISPKVVFNYAKLGATNREIAGFFGCDESVIRRRFPAELTKARAARHMTLRKWQFALARKGNATMLIWLGKNELKQSDAPGTPDDADPEPQLDAKVG
jgi:hypothetical protein